MYTSNTIARHPPQSSLAVQSILVPAIFQMDANWVVLRDVMLNHSISGAPSLPSRVCFALLHPEQGVVLLDFAPDSTSRAVERLRRALTVARFQRIFPGHLAIVYRQVSQDDIPRLADLIGAAFMDEPTTEIDGGHRWIGLARRVLGGVRIVDLGFPNTTSQDGHPYARPPEVAEWRPAASSPNFSALGYFWAVVLTTLVGGAAFLQYEYVPPLHGDRGAGVSRSTTSGSNAPKRLVASATLSASPDRPKTAAKPDPDPISALATGKPLPEMAAAVSSVAPSEFASSAHPATLLEPAVIRRAQVAGLEPMRSLNRANLDAPPPALPALPAGTSVDAPIIATDILSTAALVSPIAGDDLTLARNPDPARGTGISDPQPEIISEMPAAASSGTVTASSAQDAVPAPDQILERLREPMPDFAPAPAATATLAPADDTKAPEAVRPVPLPTRAQTAQMPGAVSHAGSAPVPSIVNSALAEIMVRRADALLQHGDVSAARLLYERAAAVGSGHAATAMGRTFDAAFLSGISVVGLSADPALAAKWYRRGLDLGDEEARVRLQILQPAPSRTNIAMEAHPQ